MTIIVFSANDEGISVELTTEKLHKAFEKFKENIDEYFMEFWEEDELKLGEVLYDYESEEDNAEKHFYFVDEEEESKFNTLEELYGFISEKLKA